MHNTLLEVHLPSTLLEFGLDQREIEQRIIEWLVLSLFTEERISSGKAARLLGISRIEFLALLRKHGIPFVDYSDAELGEEFAAAEALPEIRKQ
jgi:predicted HTH domain antitoxin